MFCSMLLVVVKAVAAHVLHHVLLLCPVCWEVASIRGGGEAQARIPAPGQPSPIAVLTMFGESAAAMDCLVVLCGTVFGEW